MTRTWIGTNWKMHKTLAECLAFADALAGLLPDVDARIQPFIIPPFTGVREVKKALAHTRVAVGAQNMHWADYGPWTGEISPVMLTDCGLDLVELGHSERRTHFAETDEAVGRKVEAAIRHRLIPLICVGETLAERESGRAGDVLAAQVAGALQFLGDEAREAELLFAYEPVWAIGENGIPASADYADRQQALVKEVAGSLLPRTPPVLYGGSVNPHNTAELIRQPHIDGLFVGRSAWEPAGFAEIMRLAAAAM